METLSSLIEEESYSRSHSIHILKGFVFFRITVIPSPISANNGMGKGKQHSSLLDLLHRDEDTRKNKQKAASTSLRQR